MKAFIPMFISTLILLLTLCPVPARIVKRAVNWNGNDWAFACDFIGQDLSNIQVRGEDCGSRCAQTSGCTHFTWTTYNSGTCWMKSGAVSKNDAVSTNDQSMVCGVVNSNSGGRGGGSSAINWNGNTWATSCDFHGNDLSNAQVPSSQCGGQCAQTQGCTHFTWTIYNGGTCWMKSGSVSKNDAFSTNDPDTVCGVISSGISPGAASGRTTRYWDCCKPSCGWSGKVSSRNTYVKSCRRDGYSAFNNPDARSGCDGGEAFTCNNQHPWPVNGQLAYGFAAATIPGLSEQERCCACYKLDFTSVPLQGKSMIVQVTNSGSDVNPNQFDLQIPGGGVGKFNGCTPQWNAPGNGWGQLYGGAGSRQECYQLPAEIRDGCFFRFDWFRGADNPTMTYSRVQCPSELEAITGCAR